MPPKVKDHQNDLRIDAGHYDEKTKLLHVNLQVNADPHAESLKKFIKKNSTHAVLANATFDTSAKDKDAELDNMFTTLDAEQKKNLG